MSKPKLALTCRWTKAAMEQISKDFKIVLPDTDNRLDKAYLSAIEGAVALCPVFYDRVDAKLIGKLPDSVKIIASFGAGTDHIDLEAAKAHGLCVSNTPDELTDDTADIAMGLILAAMRRFRGNEQHLRSGTWTGAKVADDLALCLTGKTLGILGMGRIGTATARRARAFGMDILYHNRNRQSETEKDLNARYADSPGSLFREADVISLHAPLTEETRHIVDEAAIRTMKPEVVIVNTGRGPLIDEAALINALETGRIYGAGLDVYEFEPEVSERLRALENVTLLPHIGSATQETRTVMGLRVADNVHAVLENGKPLNPVV